MDSYIYIIVALLPLVAVILVLQVNPYQALVIRGILGALAALVYALLGAADVALTEALVGTMLAITLYVVAVRSSLVMQLGILQLETETNGKFTELIANLRKVINKHYLRLEITEYPTVEALETALMAKKVHAICVTGEREEQPNHENITTLIDTKQTYHTTIRVRRLFEIMENELTFPGTSFTYVTVANVEDKH